MKKLKPIMFVVSGMLLAFVFAFKSNSNAPAKEFATVSVHTSSMVIFKPGEEEKKIEIKISDRKESLSVLNELGKEGWQIKSTIGGAGTMGYPMYTIFFERDKQ